MRGRGLMVVALAVLLLVGCSSEEPEREASDGSGRVERSTETVGEGESDPADLELPDGLESELADQDLTVEQVAAHACGAAELAPDGAAEVAVEMVRGDAVAGGMDAAEVDAAIERECGELVE